MRKGSRLYRALVVGAGRIGATFDNPLSTRVLTHAHAYTRHPDFELVGFVDANIVAAIEATKIWGGKAYRSLEEAFLAEAIDVVSVCVPDEQHLETIEKLKSYKIQGGMLEKPLTGVSCQSQRLCADPFFIDRPFLVNYSRRFVPEFQVLARDIAAGMYGKLLAGQGWYGKGLMHNGSHLLDLLSFFGMDIVKAQPFASMCDFTEHDPTYSVILSSESGTQFLLQGIDSRVVTVFEAIWCFERARIRLIDSGFLLGIAERKESEVFKGYKNYRDEVMTQTSMGDALYYAVDELANGLQQGGAPTCGVGHAYAVERLCEDIRAVYEKTHSPLRS